MLSRTRRGHATAAASARARSVHVKGERVRPQDIQNCGLLTVEGELDDISGAGQTKAAHDLCTGIPKSHQKHYDVIGAGHYGIFSGRRWRDLAYPVIRDFILQHDHRSPTVDAPVPRSRKKE